MKKLKVFLGLFVCALMVFPFMGVKAAPLEVSDYEGLKAAMENGGEYTLKNDIEIEEPLVSSKDVTIFGNDFTIKPVSDASATWPNPNKTLITSSLEGTITLNGVVLDGAPKYGVQAHNGGHVVLNGVVIKNSGFGAVNINGGTVTIKSLVMENNTYGIEFSIGDNVTGVPTLVMDGTIEATNQVTPIHVDTTQITADKTITVENTADTLQTVDLEGTKIVIKDESGKTVLESDDLLEGTEVTVNTEKTEEPVTPEEPVEEDKKDEVKDEVENPKTSDGIILTISVLALSGVVAFVAKKKIA